MNAALVSCTDKIAQVATVYIDGPDWSKSALWYVVFHWRVLGHSFAPEMPSAFAFEGFEPFTFFNMLKYASDPYNKNQNIKKK